MQLFGEYHGEFADFQNKKGRVHDIAGVDVGGEMDVAFWHQAFYVIQEGEVRFGEIWWVRLAKAY